MIGKPQRIMIVDDDESVRLFVSKVLRDSGYDIACASDGQIALNLLDEYHPDLILLDILMPVLNGIEVLKNMSERSDSFPVIMLTGLSDTDSLEQAFNLGAAGYITKPFLPSVLLAHIRAKLRRTPNRLDDEDRREPEQGL